MIGEPCGHHGPYTFFKGIRISPISSIVPSMEMDYRLNYVKNNNCLDAIDRKTAELLRSNDTIIKSIKHEFDDTDSTSEGVDELPLPRNIHKTEVKPRLTEGW